MIGDLVAVLVWLAICRVVWTEYQGQRRVDGQKQIDRLARRDRKIHA